MNSALNQSSSAGYDASLIRAELPSIGPDSINLREWKKIIFLNFN